MQTSLAAAMAALCLTALPVAASAETPLTVEVLFAERQLQLRCTMSPGVIINDQERGVRDDVLGLDQEILERLGDGLAEVLTAAQLCGCAGRWPLLVRAQKRLCRCHARAEGR